jgi:hypothetical protein
MWDSPSAWAVTGDAARAAASNSFFIGFSWELQANFVFAGGKRCESLILSRPNGTLQ